MGHQKPMSPEIINKGHTTITVSARRVSYDLTIKFILKDKVSSGFMRCPIYH